MTSVPILTRLCVMATTVLLAHGCSYQPAELPHGPGFGFSDMDFRSAAGGSPPAVTVRGACTAGDTLQLESRGAGEAPGGGYAEVVCAEDDTFEVLVPVGYDSGEVEICVSVLPLEGLSVSEVPGAVCDSVIVEGVCDALSAPPGVGTRGFVFGSGLSHDPWVLCSVADYRRFASNEEGDLWDQHFLLGNDLQFTAADPVPPVGTEARPFRGSFEGYEHHMSDVTIAPPVVPVSMGLFGYIGDGSTAADMTLVANLHLERVNLPLGARAQVGPLVGTVAGGRVDGCSVKDTEFTVSGESWGGIVGQLASERASLANSHVVNARILLTSDTTSFNADIGGAVGTNIGGELYAVMVRGTIRMALVGAAGGANNVGGLVGRNDGLVHYCNVMGSCEASSATLQACIAGQMQVGGLLGQNSGRVVSSNVELSAATLSGAVTEDRAWVWAPQGMVGGLIGLNESMGMTGSPTPEVVASHAYVAQVSSLSSSAGEGVGTAAGHVGGLVGWHHTYEPLNPGIIDDCHVSGAVSDSQGAMTLRGGDYIGGLVGAATAIISDSSARVNIEASGMNVGGLVGYAAFPISRSDAVVDIAATASYVGGLVGRAGPGALIEGGTVEGSVSSPDGERIGGFVGWLEGTLDGGTADVEVTGRTYVGGLVGKTDNTLGGTPRVINGTAHGDVAGSSSAGGLVGYAHGEVKNGHATGDVSGYSRVGGLIGTTDGDISDSLSEGAVSGEYERIGGLVGSGEGASIADCRAYGRVDAAAGAFYVGGLLGLGLATPVENSEAKGNVKVIGNDVGGLIGSTNSSVIDSKVRGNTTGATRVGGVVGYLEYPGTLSRAQFHKDATVWGCSHVGGLVGISDSATFITESAAEGDVRQRTELACGDAHEFGGAIGQLGGAMSTTYASGDVNAMGDTVSSAVGGLVGEATNPQAGLLDTGYLTDSYALGDVQGDYGVGSLVGESYDSPTLRFSFALGRVEGTDNPLTSESPLVGEVGGPTGVEAPTVEGCYYSEHESTDLYGTYRADDSTERTLDEFPGFQDTLWYMPEGESYPRLLWTQ